MRLRILIARYKIFLILWIILIIIFMGSYKIKENNFLVDLVSSPVFLFTELIFDYPDNKMTDEIDMLYRRLDILELEKNNVDTPAKRSDLLKEFENYNGYFDYMRKVRLFSIFFFTFFLPLLINYYYRKKHPIEFYICPNDKCKMSFKIYYRWFCDNCRQIQNKEHYITDKCDRCPQGLDTFVCEHCKTEFKL